MPSLAPLDPLNPSNPPNPPSNPPLIHPKKRTAIDDVDRKKIRKRHKQHPGPQLALITWFKQETGR
jgi:hypothetical protein